MLTCPKKQRQERAQESRQKLMDAALAMFSTNGYVGTNTRAICRSAGVAAGLLYHYFPGGKQELLQEIVREKLAEIETRAHQRDPELAALPLEDALDRVFTAAVKMFEENTDLFRLAVREEEVHRVLQYGSLYQLLGQQQWLPALLERESAGRLSPTDITYITDTLFALITNYFLGRLTDLDGHHYYTEEHCRSLLRYQCKLLRGAMDLPAKQAGKRSEADA